MRICVFGAASPTIDEKYIKATEQMGEELAKRGHSLIFGGGGNGLMGAAAIGFRNGNAHIIGVIPKFFKEEAVEAICDFCDELIMPDTMRERKQLMEDEADAFIVVPGGIGTYEEFFEVLTLKQLRRHNKPIAVYNLFGYYNELNATMLSAMDKEFIKKNCKQLYRISEDLGNIVHYIEGDDSTENYSIQDLKNG